MKHVLIDGNNLLCRYFYVRQHLTDPEGNKVSGVLGVVESLNTYSRVFGKAQVYLIWDGDRCAERLRIYPDYKKQRDNLPISNDKPDILRQREVIMQIVDSVNIPQVLIPNMEADDVISLLCKELPGQKVIVSSDRDFIQLISELVQLYVISKDETLNYENIDQVLGFPQAKYVLWKCLVGDKSDNIVGVRGIGPVKATKAILANEIKPEWREVIRLNKQLITTGVSITPKQRAEIKKQIRSCLARTPDYERVYDLFQKYNFTVLSRSIDQWRKPFAEVRA